MGLLCREEARKKKKIKKNTKAKLSFAADDGEEGDDAAVSQANSTPAEDSDSSRPTKRARKLGKNPAVDTTFLPDREREENERKQREELRQEWLRRQEEMKAETINVVFSYWDGNGHRKDVDVSRIARSSEIYLLKPSTDSVRRATR